MQWTLFLILVFHGACQFVILEYPRSFPLTARPLVLPHSLAGRTLTTQE